jgi:hypothetical protein
MMLLEFEAMPDEPHAVLTPALRAALQQLRSANGPLMPHAPLPPVTTVAPVPAPPLASAPTPAVVTTAPVSTPSVTAPVGPVGPTGIGDSSLGKIITASELTDSKVIADPAGQWAASATAGSQYGKTQYSAAQATGAPNISVAGNSPDAWCPASKTNGTDWLEVTFAKPVHAAEVRVRQNDAAGAITKIEAIDSDGTAHVWWDGVDPYKAPAVREIVWFAVRAPKTAYLVAKVRITLNLAAGPGWKEIDAVQLVGAAQ